MSQKSWKFGDEGIIQYSRDNQFPVGTRVKLIGHPNKHNKVSVAKVNRPSERLTIDVSDLKG